MNTDRIVGKTWQAIRQSGVILILAVLAGLLMNQARPNTLPLAANLVPEDRLTTGAGENIVVSLEEAKLLCSDKQAIFLDARSPELYDQGHIQCALNIPWQSFDEYIDCVFETIPDNAWIVIYCDGEHCSLSEDLAKELFSMGYKKVKVLLNGWTRWLEAGFPIEQGLNHVPGLPFETESLKNGRCISLFTVGG